MSAGWWVAGIAALTITISGCVGCAGGCGEGYSEGDRHGTISKFSRKGITWKSWEGELVLGGIRPDTNGTAGANVWAFHAPDRLAKQITAAMESGRPVTLHYRQWMASPIDQDSAYDVTKITVDPEPTKPTVAP